MNNQKVAVLGFTASGKTTYTLGMYNFMLDGVGCFSLKETDKDQHKFLTKVWDDITQHGKWPMLSDDRSEYTFSLRHNLIPILNFSWMDYPGAVVVDVDHDLADLFRKDLTEASCLLVLVNGESFAYAGNPKDHKRIQANDDDEYINTVKRNLRRNSDLRAIMALSDLASQGISLPPVAIVVTKSDLIEDCWAHCLPQILTDSFKPIFGENCPDERIVMLSAVTLGDIENGYVDPVGVEDPIVFAVLSILLRRVQMKKLLKQQAMNQLSDKQKKLFANIFQGRKKEQLKAEIERTDADIQKMIQDAGYLFEMLDIDKPVYINNQKKDLRTFFTDALNDSQ